MTAKTTPRAIISLFILSKIANAISVRIDPNVISFPKLP